MTARTRQKLLLLAIGVLTASRLTLCMTASAQTAATEPSTANSTTSATSATSPTETALSAGSSVDEILEALDQRGQPPLEFIARLADHEGDPNIGSDKTRTGMIWFSRSSDSSLRIHVVFDKLLVNHLSQDQKREYLLDGDWLIDRNYQAKTESKHQVMKPGEKRDLMKLGAGPFPLPIGQSPADVKKAFDVSKAAPDKDDPPATVHLALTPKANSPLAKKFTAIDVWVDLKTHMPVVIDTLSADEHRVELKEIQVNPTPKLEEKFFTLPDGGNNWSSTTDSYDN